jgi:23S rRNA (pseudouridine1915-N3)-methyltransferase
MNITVVCVGKIKESFYRDAIAEYSKRLSKYCRYSIVEVSDEETPENASALEEEKIKRTEGERILKKLPNNAYVIALAIDGNRKDSVKFSKDLSALFLDGKSEIAFVIGGSLGLSDEVLKRADERLSFSDMTFPHQLMRVILSEQIYRAFRIMKGEPYHK